MKHINKFTSEEAYNTFITSNSIPEPIRKITKRFYILIKSNYLTFESLEEYCYTSMFGWCTNLEIAPVLPATKLGQGCYHYMFKGYTSLNSVTCLYELPEYIDSYTFYNWLYNTSSAGTLKVVIFTKS